MRSFRDLNVRTLQPPIPVTRLRGVLARTFWPCVPAALGATLFPMLAQAQQQAPGVQATPATDEQVIRTYQASSPGGPTPVLQPQGQGTQLVWTGGAAVDAYRNEVQSASGFTGSPMSSGNFGKVTTQGDLRATYADGAVDFLRFNTVHTNDRAVLPVSRYQIGSLQFGRTSSTYSLAAGDVAPNFSPLSSALGVRGVLGQVNVGNTAVFGYSGQVVESWEALGRDRLRTQPIRSVRGAKVELPLGETVRGYVTSQHYTERRLPAFAGDEAMGLPAASSTNSTVGLQYTSSQFTVAVEAGASQLEDAAQGDRSGHAGVIDGTWRVADNASMRFGLHSIDPEYTSLSQAARPGIDEAYVAADWGAFSWLTLGGDVRRTRNTTLATPSFASLTSDTDSAALNANINFGPDWPGWTFGLQHAVSQTTAAVDQRQSNRQRNVSISYSSPVWTLNLTHMRNRVENSSYPDGDSTTDGWSWNVRRTLGSATPGEWTAAIGLAGKTQIQRMASGTRPESGDIALQFAADRPGWGSLNFLASFGSIAQAQDVPSVRTRTYQLDATRPLNAQAQLKLYARYNLRRGADPLLELVEKTVGVQLLANF